MLQFDCSADAQTVKIAYRGTPEKELLQRLYDDVGEIPKLKVKAKPFAFQVEIKVTP